MRLAKKKPRKKTRQLIIDEPLKKKKKLRKRIEKEFLESLEEFEHQAPFCLSCGSNSYSACNLDDDSNVVECSECPLYMRLH